MSTLFLASLGLGVSALKLLTFAPCMTENQMVSGAIHRVVNGLPEDVDFNAKAQRRKGAEQ